MNDLRKSKPRDFWKIFKNKKPVINSSNISLQQFHDHFKQLTCEYDTNTEITIFTEVESPTWESTYEELDQPITTEELEKACKQLGTNKTCALDELIYEYFKESINITGNAILSIFNYILDTGIQGIFRNLGVKG